VAPLTAVQFTLYPACSASFFSRNSIFLSQYFNQNSVFSYFKPSFSKPNGASIIFKKRVRILNKHILYCLKLTEKDACYYKVLLAEVQYGWFDTGAAQNFRESDIVGNMSMSLYENTESSLKIHRRKT